MIIHKVGLIGCGWVAPVHMQALGKLDERVRVLWVADPVQEQAEALEQKAGARPLTDLHQGLNDVDCDIVRVPHHFHHSLTLDSLNSGCHVLLEKPIAIILEQAEQMISAAERAGKTLMVAHPHRYRASVRFFKQVIETGRYGKLFMLDRMMDESVQGYTALGWVAKKETLGGGIYFSASTPMLDAMLWIGGDVKTVATVGIHGGPFMEGEDTAASVFKFKNGIIGMTRHAWVSPEGRTLYSINATCEKAQITMTTGALGNEVAEYVRCPWSTRIVAQGTREEVLLESDESLLDFGPEHRDFFECVETGRQPLTSGR